MALIFDVAIAIAIEISIFVQIDYKNETISFLYDRYCVQAKYCKIEKNFPFIPDFLDFVMQNKGNSIDFFCVPRNSIKEKDLTPELHVHHKYYIKGKKPWEYDNKVLLTLCKSCHKLEHMKNSINVYNTSNEILESNNCSSCQGLGYIENNNNEEICLICKGLGVLL